MEIEIIKVQIHTDFITLGQLLKYKGIIAMGNEAKLFLLDNEVLVNGQNENRRGRKLYPGDLITIDDKTYSIEHKGEENE